MGLSCRLWISFSAFTNTFLRRASVGFSRLPKAQLRLRTSAQTKGEQLRRKSNLIWTKLERKRNILNHKREVTATHIFSLDSLMRKRKTSNFSFIGSEVPQYFQGLLYIDITFETDLIQFTPRCSGLEYNANIVPISLEVIISCWLSRYQISFIW